MVSFTFSKNLSELSKRAEGRGQRFFKTLSAGETRVSNPQTGGHLIELNRQRN